MEGFYVEMQFKITSKKSQLMQVLKMIQIIFSEKILEKKLGWPQITEILVTLRKLEEGSSCCICHSDTMQVMVFCLYRWQMFISITERDIITDVYDTHLIKKLF
jgi:hypothetical protein